MNMKLLSLLLMLCLFSTSGYSAEATVEDKINTLNEATVNSLGISLPALSYLMKASPSSYIPLWHLNESGDMDYIRELEKAGYVKVIISKGLPDGQMGNEKQVNVTPLEVGIEIQQYMMALKHNKTVKQTD